MDRADRRCARKFILSCSHGPVGRLFGFSAIREMDRSQGRWLQRHGAYTRLASRLIWVPASATDTGQFFFVSSACSLNFVSSIPGTSASVFKSIVVIFGPPPTISSFTVAVVLIRFAGCPAFSKFAESAIEKQPASAAPISSSGFVPLPSSKRDENE